MCWQARGRAQKIMYNINELVPHRLFIPFSIYAKMHQYSILVLDTVFFVCYLGLLCASRTAAATCIIKKCKRNWTNE